MGVRRRYGSITKKRSISWRFHEYTLLRQVRAKPAAQIDPTKLAAPTPDRTSSELMAIVTMASLAEEPMDAPIEEMVEDPSCRVFHVMPSRPQRGRPKREEESDQAALWRLVAPSLDLELSKTCVSNPDQTAGCVTKGVLG